MKRSLCTNAYATRTSCAIWALSARAATSRFSWRKCLEVSALRGRQMELGVVGPGDGAKQGVGSPPGKMTPSLCGWYSPELAEAVRLGDGSWAMAWPSSRQLWAGLSGCQLWPWTAPSQAACPPCCGQCGDPCRTTRAPSVSTPARSCRDSATCTTTTLCIEISRSACSWLTLVGGGVGKREEKRGLQTQAGSLD